MVKRVAKIRSRPVRIGKRVLPVGARLVCADNTGARVLQLISVSTYKGVHRRLAMAAVGDMINCRVARGKPDLKNEVHQAVVVRQAKEFMRPDGTRVRFEDNAAVLTNADGDLKGTEIKGAVAREAANKWPALSGASKSVI